MIKPSLKIDERFKKRVQARYERFELQAGILNDKPHHVPKPAKPKGKGKSFRARGLGTLEGGPVRLQKRKTSGTLTQIGERIRKRLGVNWLKAPFERDTPEVKAFRKALSDLLKGVNKNYSAVESRLRAVLRIPILKKRYGRNTAAAERRKTFNRFLIDTGQFYKSIAAKVRSRKR